MVRVVVEMNPVFKRSFQRACAIRLRSGAAHTIEGAICWTQHHDTDKRKMENFRRDDDDDGVPFNLIIEHGEIDDGSLS